MVALQQPGLRGLQAADAVSPFRPDVPLAGLLGSAVDERPVVEVRLRQDLALLLVLQHVGPRLAIALFEQDVLLAMT